MYKIYIYIYIYNIYIYIHIYMYIYIYIYVWVVTQAKHMSPQKKRVPRIVRRCEQSDLRAERPVENEMEAGET